LISQVTEEVMEEVRAWQSRPLEPLYMIVYLDALVVKMRHEGRVDNRAVFVAIGVTMEGAKEVLGLWTSATEGAKLWLQILTEIRNRGVADILVACVDGLKGFPEAISTVYPRTEVQLCIVHMVRNSLAYVNWKERKAVAEDLRSIYRAATAEAGTAALGRHQSPVCVSGRDPPGDLHDQCGRIAAHDAAEGDQDAGIVSERGIRAQAVVSGAPQYHATLAAGSELAHFVEPFPAAVG
jgi:transposase-like protein